MLNDGVCNKECNNRECAYDNGDCVSENIENGMELDADKEVRFILVQSGSLKPLLLVERNIQ